MERVILVADDEPHIRLLIEQSLEELADEGVEIVTVGDGQTALETIKATSAGSWSCLTR